MTMERTERVHTHASRGHTIAVTKIRQGYPSDDMKHIVITARGIAVTIDRDGPIPGMAVTSLALVTEPEDARDLGLAITQAADDLLAEQIKAEES